MSERGGNQRKQGAGGGRAAVAVGLRLCASAVLACNALLGGCEEPAAVRTWPEGTLLAVDEVPITSQELAQDVAAVLLLEPQWGEVQLRRLAFNSISLPRALARARVPGQVRDDARREIDALYTRIVQGTQIGPPTQDGLFGQERAGAWSKVGLVAWGVAMQMSPGEWSEVFEEPGAFLRVRLIETLQAKIPAAVNVRLDVLAVPFGDALASKTPDDKELSSHRLTIVDPAWEAIVPERTKYLMGVNRR